MLWYELLDEQLRDYLPDLPVTAEEPLAKHTSFRIGGPAEVMAFPKNSGELGQLLNKSVLLDTYNDRIYLYSTLYSSS